MPVKWEEKMDVKLLCTIIKIINGQVSGEDWTKVAEAMGDEFTPKSCRLHFAKIQKDAAGGVEAPIADDSVASSASGRKRKGKEGSASEPSPKKPKKSSNAPVKQEDDGGLTPGSQSSS